MELKHGGLRPLHLIRWAVRISVWEEDVTFFIYVASGSEIVTATAHTTNPRQAKCVICRAACRGTPFLTTANSVRVP